LSFLEKGRIKQDLRSVHLVGHLGAVVLDLSAPDRVAGGIMAKGFRIGGFVFQCLA
jgi:hypothetical protein